MWIKDIQAIVVGVIITLHKIRPTASQPSALCLEQTEQLLDVVLDETFQDAIAAAIEANEECFDRDRGNGSTRKQCWNDFTDVYSIEQACREAQGQLLEQIWNHGCTDSWGTADTYIYQQVPNCVGNICGWVDFEEMEPNVALPSHFVGTSGGQECRWFPPQTVSLEGGLNLNTTAPAQPPQTTSDFLPSSSPTITFAPMTTFAPSSPPSTCVENEATTNSIISSATIGSAFGFIAFVLIYVVNIFKSGGKWFDIRSLVFIALEALSIGMAAAFAGRPATPEEVCSGSSNGAYVTDTLSGFVVLLFGLVEFIFDMICCCGDPTRDGYRSYAGQRLLNANTSSKELNQCQWWTVTGVALAMGTLGAVALIIDLIADDFDWWAILLFGLWEGFALILCLMSAFSVGGCFQDWKRSSIWATVKWLCIDGPGAVAILAGLQGSIVAFLVQGVVELILFCGEKCEEEDG